MSNVQQLLDDVNYRIECADVDNHGEMEDLHFQQEQLLLQLERENTT